MSDDLFAKHTIGNLMAQRDALKRQLQSASKIIRDVIAGTPDAKKRGIQ